MSSKRSIFPNMYIKVRNTFILHWTHIPDASITFLKITPYLFTFYKISFDKYGAKIISNFSSNQFFTNCPLSIPEHIRAQIRQYSAFCLYFWCLKLCNLPVWNHRLTRCTFRSVGSGILRHMFDENIHGQLLILFSLLWTQFFQSF